MNHFKPKPMVLQSHASEPTARRRNSNAGLVASVSGTWMALRSICDMVPEMSSIVKWMELSSSRRKELDMFVFWSFIMSSFIATSTSWDTVSVPYLSSQYMVEILYSCWMDSTGHSSRVISLSVFLGF